MGMVDEYANVRMKVSKEHPKVRVKMVK